MATSKSNALSQRMAAVVREQRRRGPVLQAGLHCHDQAIERMVGEVDTWYHRAHEDCNRGDDGNAANDLMLTGALAIHAMMCNKLKAILQRTVDDCRDVYAATREEVRRVNERADGGIGVPAHLRASADEETLDNAPIFCYPCG